MVQGLPDGPLLAYYGDDFTGSTDVMEAFTAAGLPTVLFLEPPDPETLQRFPGVRCIGLAGDSRRRDPAWMDHALPGAFRSLKQLGAPILHYKVCSTFDSSPTVGSIGKAVDIGAPLMPGQWSPMIVGSPRLRRYQAFGNLFAAMDGIGHRLDRHPSMSRHPVTPMDEADLRRHLARQTSRRTELVDFVQLKARRDGLATGGPDKPIVLIDVLDDETLVEAGRLVWENRGDGIFSASSSGLEYALVAYWRQRGWLARDHALPPAEPVPNIAVISGSCSPVTASQITWAAAHGFKAERLDTRKAMDRSVAEQEVTRVVSAAADVLLDGGSPIVFSALGPDDAAVKDFDAHAARIGVTRAEAALRIGKALAEVTRRLLDRRDLRRIVIAGGDSSSEVVSALNITALSVVAALAPGAPLCRIWSRDAARDGLEIVLKGGQMGADSFFGVVRGDVRAGGSPGQ